MKDTRRVRIFVGPVMSRAEGEPPTRDLFEQFVVWDRGVACYRADNTFYTGLLDEVAAAIRVQNIAIEIFDERPAISSRSWTLHGVAPRDYQERVADHLVKRRLTLAKLPSAAGKSVAALTAIARSGARRVLFLVDRLDLAFQFEDVVRRHLEIAPGFVGAGRFEIDAPLVIACVDSALTRELGDFDLTIVDECHMAGAGGCFRLVEKIASPLRLGLSATPFRSNREEDLLLRSLFGAPVELATLDELERGGFVSRPVLRVVPVKARPLELTLVWRELEEALVDCRERNDLIVRESMALADTGHNVLVLVRLIRHGEKLAGRFASAGRIVPLVTGAMNAARRHDLVGRFRDGRGGILVSSEVLAVGVDVPSLGAIVLACGMHAKVATLQKVGRAMRASPGGAPLVKRVIDFDDDLHPTLARHAMTRRKWLREVLGLREEP